MRLRRGIMRFCAPGFALISVPAGFGKTTLLSEFVAGLHQPVACLSLDDGATLSNSPITSS